MVKKKKTIIRIRNLLLNKRIKVSNKVFERDRKSINLIHKKYAIIAIEKGGVVLIMQKCHREKLGMRINIKEFLSEKISPKTQKKIVRKYYSRLFEN
jgi:hypothetical protein